MEIVILCGGLGTRLSEETQVKPKPMVEIGGNPILWHIMKIYSHYGINDFIICCGYKGYIIKEYFSNYFLHNSDVTFDISKNSMEVINKRAEKWKVTLIDTGYNTMTGGRLKRVSNYLKNEDFFCFTYGDGLIDLDLKDLIHFHKKHKKMATVTSVNPTSRFGAMKIKDNNVISFSEKPKEISGDINGGFFVLSPKVFEEIDNDDTIWEKEPLQNLSKKGELMAYKHDGFWQPMDTLRDQKYLNDLFEKNKAPWKKW